MLRQILLLFVGFVYCIGAVDCALNFKLEGKFSVNASDTYHTESVFDCAGDCGILKCEGIVYNEIDRLCYRVGQAADFDKHLHDDGPWDYWRKVQNNKKDFLLITDAGAVYVYSMMKKTWSMANNKGAHMYGFLLDASRRELYITKYGNIMSSSLSDEPLSLKLSFKELAKIANESIHGLTADWTMEYMFTLGICTDGRYAVIRVKTDGSDTQCITYFSKRDSFFEDKIVADQRTRMLYFMSSFEKKLMKCDYNGESMKALATWKSKKIIDITFNYKMETLVYVERRKLFVMNLQTKAVRNFSISDTPRCVFTMDGNIVIMHERVGQILTEDGVIVDKIEGNEKHHFQACIGDHFEI